MKREDVLVWISTAWFVALCGLAIWYFLSPRAGNLVSPHRVYRVSFPAPSFASGCLDIQYAKSSFDPCIPTKAARVPERPGMAARGQT
jgi:hypothetical protein